MEDDKLRKFKEKYPELTEDKEFTLRLFYGSPIGIYIAQKRRFKLVNPEFVKMIKYDEEELLKMEDTVEVVHPEDREKARKNAIAMLKGQRKVPYLYRLKAKDGEIKHVLETICSVRFNKERAVLGFVMDHTEQEKIKEALKRSEEKFHKAFRSSPDWIVISTLDEGIYLEVNDAFLYTTGYELDEVIGKSSIELGIWVDPKQREELRKILLETGRVCNAEVQFRTKHGDILYVLWSAEVIEYQGKKCLIAISRNITDKKIAEQELLRREKLQGVLELAGAACHEMNQPLQNIFFILDELIEKYPDEEMCKKLKEQVQRIADITNKLENITTYETKDYVQGLKIIDIDKSCPLNLSSLSKKVQN